MELTFKVLIGIGSLYFGLLVGAYFLQSRLLYHPDTSRILPDAMGLSDVDERMIETRGGTRILTWWGKAQPGRLTLIYFHGNAGSPATRSERIRKYLAQGYGVVMMTYRGFGGRDGRPTERANVADAKALYEAVVASGVDPRSIVLYGESLGTGVAIQVAAEKPVAGVILDAPYTSMVDVAGLHYPYLPARWLMTDRYDSTQFIAKLTAPILIVHGEDDVVVPVEMGREMAARAKAPVEFKTFAGAGHADHYLFGSYDAIYAWLTRLEAGKEKGAVPIGSAAPSKIQ